MAAVGTKPTHGRTVRHSKDLVAEKARREQVPPAPRSNADLPRSASYTYMPLPRDQKYAQPAVVTIEGSFPPKVYSTTSEDGLDSSSPSSSGWTTPDEPANASKEEEDKGQYLVQRLRESSKIAAQPPTDTPTQDHRSSVDSHARDSSLESSRTESTAATTPASHTPCASVNSTYSRKPNRYSWLGTSNGSPPSRSPSPPKNQGSSTTQLKVRTDVAALSQAPQSDRKRPFLKRSLSAKPWKEKKSEEQDVQLRDEAAEKLPGSRSATVSLRTRHVGGLLKPLTTLPHATSNHSIQFRPSLPSLPKSFSTDRLPTSNPSDNIPDVPTPVPRLMSAERFKASTLSLPKKRDPLWSAFRDLDGDFAKFSSKTSAFKTNVVRSSLLPFLRTYASHPSNWTLRPEDLDRRANILNKWWTGLIEMLHGRNNQSIAGTDRPAVLDGVSGIMERPEWRLAPSPFCPLDQRSQGDDTTPSDQSPTSLAPSTFEFLTESVNHNVRNIFTQNLTAQMAFVVDKMSLRNAPASSVSFCGKACAYAFMFVPGMADVLVRLWEVPMDAIRRVLEENGIGKFDNVSDISTGVVQNFPPALQQLGFISLMKYMKKLRTPPPLPLGTANIQWWGQWVERWSGRESDLFYVFVKYFHILVTDFLPGGATKKQRLCAPGLALVHAQILSNLDATIHREANQTQQDPPNTASPTFDELLGYSDAIATTIPVPPTNAVRLMAENRLIMLIRDFLSERAAEHPVARQLFAESFNDILQTAARGTSMFDHAACYTLLDFAEEAIVLIVRYERMEGKKEKLVNSQFWHAVSRKMIQSHNTMTEIRLYAFLYTVWNTVVCDVDRKADLCIDFLLDPEIFESRFNHWCPMVRAYYMRLLCWRVGRYDGDAFHCDLAIFETLLERLQRTWSYYLYLRDHADQQKRPPPPTNPCHPAPSRRLLIVRTDALAVSGGNLLAFDGILPPSKLPASDAVSPASKRSSTISMMEMIERPCSQQSNSDDAESPRGKTTGLGVFLRNLMGTKPRAKSPNPPRSQTPQPALVSKADWPKPLVRSATDDPQIPRERASATTYPKQATAHRNFSFKFSLDFHPNTKPLPPMRLLPPRLPLPAQQFLHDSGSAKATTHALNSVLPAEPTGPSCARARYCGRALAEWNVVLAECQSFFERRKNEGVPGNRSVETPTLGVEVFRRPG